MLGAENEIKSQRGKKELLSGAFLEKKGKGSLCSETDWLESKSGCHLLISRTVYYDKAFNTLERRTPKEVVWLTGLSPLFLMGWEFSWGSFSCLLLFFFISFHSFLHLL